MKPYQKKRVYLGIDPGVEGVICYVEEKSLNLPGFISAFNWNDLSNGLKHLKKNFTVEYAAIEKVTVSPVQSPVSAEKLMTSFGALSFWLTYEGISHEKVKPQNWMEDLGLRKKKYPDDKPSLEFMLEAAPEVFSLLHISDGKKHNYSDAYCIALYAKEKYSKISQT
jgi:hypothetical protein